MKKLLMVSIVVVISLISCEKTDNQRISLDKDYFPLVVGNQWNFESSGRDSIVDIIKIKGVEYYKFVDDYGAASYYRKQDDRIYCKSSTTDSKDEMKFDLAADVNDTWTYGIGYVTMTSRNATISIGNVEIDSCLQFDFHLDLVEDYGHSIWLAPGIGFIQKTCQECFGSSNGTLKLKNAKINNQIIEFN